MLIGDHSETPRIFIRSIFVLGVLLPSNKLHRLARRGFTNFCKADYLIDIPAGPELMAYILQSNVEPGVIPEVRIRDWLRGRGMESVSIEDILALMRPGFAQSPPTEQARLLASIFDRERNPANIDVSRLRTDKGVTFIMQSYDRANFERNVERVRGVKDLKS
ncbi:hypothetical protein AYM40_19975 [Paraburkholderia phytofirmans OLGA172]|uniref:Uncharacterized protein n=1 Tax=Paraburkholderia phytofirmans OLGA172 TaxID=1417228 RepID=A0A160FPN4_9BURK|nr:cycle-inhibiting factor [Paraburkholderia phytofirmans]ANB74396.1 hypothetical protein AYM40_19975 [Paraburkholderia phytofirmans OLGA172]